MSRPGSFLLESSLGSLPSSLIRFQRPEKSRQLPGLSLDVSCVYLKIFQKREETVCYITFRPGARVRVGSYVLGDWVLLGGGEVLDIDDGESHATM